MAFTFKRPSYTAGKSDQTVQIDLDLCFTLKLHLQFTDTNLGYCLSY